MDRMRVGLAAVIMAVIALLVWSGYKAGVSEVHVEVFTVKVPDLPLCDATHTDAEKCVLSKPDWAAMRAGK
jgi:hypothetical protein